MHLAPSPRLWPRRAWLALVFLLAAVSLQAQTFTGIGFLNPEQEGRFSVATSISPDGNTVGAISGDCGCSDQPAASWTAGAGLLPLNVVAAANDLVSFDLFGFPNIFASNNGVFSGSVESEDESSPQRAFTITNGAAPNLLASVPVAPGDQAFAYSVGISGDGRIVAGTIVISPEEQGESPTTTYAVRWIDGADPVSLPPLPGDDVVLAVGISGDGRVVIGVSGATVGESSGSNAHAVRWVDGGPAEALTAPDVFGIPTAVSNNGQFITLITGIDLEVLAEFNTVIWDNGSTTTLDFEEGYPVFPSAISDKGVMVGMSVALEPVIRVSGTTVIPLQDYLIAAGFNLTGWSLYDVTDISADGNVIVGGAYNADDDLEGFVASKPRSGSGGGGPTTPVGVYLLGPTYTADINAAGQMIARIARSGVSGPLTVTYSTTDGTAFAGRDYTAVTGSVTFAPGEDTKTVVVPLSLGAFDGTTFTFNIVAPDGVPVPTPKMTVTIRNRLTYAAAIQDAWNQSTAYFAAGDQGNGYATIAYYYYYLYLQESILRVNPDVSNLNKFYTYLAYAYFINYQAAGNDAAAYAWYNYIISFLKP